MIKKDQDDAYIVWNAWESRSIVFIWNFIITRKITPTIHLHNVGLTKLFVVQFKSKTGLFGSFIFDKSEPRGKCKKDVLRNQK